jgi:GTP-binding protein
MARCRTIIHLIDASQDRDLVADFDAINRELELFDPALGRKSQVVAANKIDLPEARARGEELRKKLKRRKIDVHLVSGATGEGVAELVDATMRALDSAPMPSPLQRDVHPAAPDEAPNAEAVEDERELDSRARARRAPPLTGRRKDGVLKAKAAAQTKKPRSRRT